MNELCEEPMKNCAAAKLLGLYPFGPALAASVSDVER